MLKRTESEEREIKQLAPYAMKSRNSGGRRYREPEHPYRTCYQRDRDRIIHSTAFRRLQYKTQVFVNHEGDYYRTRLTHTLEVAQIARSITAALNLNETLAETIALAHDLGHTPFGHAGEDALHDLMKDHGGFNHNAQGLRVVDVLERRYPDFPGLNLTWEVREGICKHTTAYDTLVPEQDLAPDKQPCLEAQIVDMADEIAYDNHDLDDGITSGLISLDVLKKVEPCRGIVRSSTKRHAKVSLEVKKYQMIRSLINLEATDLITESLRLLRIYRIRNTDDVHKYPERLICFSPAMELRRQPLKEFLKKNLYQHYRVVRMSNKSYRFIQQLFGVYLDKPEQLPPSSRSRLRREGVYRVICDYIAGMTDRYCLDEYKKFFEPYERV